MLLSEAHAEKVADRGLDAGRAFPVPIHPEDRLAVDRHLGPGGDGDPEPADDSGALVVQEREGLPGGHPPGVAVTAAAVPAPFVFRGAAPRDAEAAESAAEGGRGLGDFVLLPWRVATSPGLFQDVEGIGVFVPALLPVILLLVLRGGTSERTLGFLGAGVTVIWFVLDQELRFLSPAVLPSTALAAAGLPAGFNAASSVNVFTPLIVTLRTPAEASRPLVNCGVWK